MEAGEGVREGAEGASGAWEGREGRREGREQDPCTDIFVGVTDY